MILKRKSLDELKSHFFLGVKFGIAGSLIGFILHAIWGNHEDIIYSIFNGFFIGFFIGFFELIFSNPKIVQFPYSLILLFRTITYFVITLLSIYTFLVIYIRNIGLTTKALRDPQKFEEIKDIYFLTDINTI